VTAQPLLSVIIPVLNEAASIVSALEALAPLRARAAEVIVVDGGSTDDTMALAAPFADRIIASTRGRATQMNAGAATARGDVIWFLHADTRLPADADRLVLDGLDRRPDPLTGPGVEDGDRALVGLVEAADQPEQGGLPAAAGADNGQPAVQGDVEIDSGHGHGFAEYPRYPPQLQPGAGRAGPARRHRACSVRLCPAGSTVTGSRTARTGHLPLDQEK